MMKMKLCGLIAALSALVSLGVSARAESSTEIHLRSGDMSLNSFLEMVSEKLDISISVSGIEGSGKKLLTVPNLGSLSRDRAKDLVISILHLRGWAWVVDPTTQFVRILPLREARDQEIPIIFDPALLPKNELLVTFVATVRNVPAEYMVRSLRMFMPANSRVVPIESTRSILITDSARNIEKLRAIIEKLDTSKVAKEAKEKLMQSESQPVCAPSSMNANGSVAWIYLALIFLIAVVIGFALRGYVIRRIEGGL